MLSTREEDQEAQRGMRSVSLEWNEQSTQLGTSNDVVDVKTCGGGGRGRAEAAVRHWTQLGRPPEFPPTPPAKAPSTT